MWRFIVLASMAAVLFAAQLPAPTRQTDPLPPTLPFVQTHAPGTPALDQGPPPTLPLLVTPPPGTPLPDPGDPPVRPPRDGWWYLPLITRSP